MTLPTLSLFPEIRSIEQGIANINLSGKSCELFSLLICEFQNPDLSKITIDSRLILQLVDSFSELSGEEFMATVVSLAALSYTPGTTTHVDVIGIVLVALADKLILNDLQRDLYESLATPVEWLEKAKTYFKTGEISKQTLCDFCQSTISSELPTRNYRSNQGVVWKPLEIVAMVCQHLSELIGTTKALDILTLSSFNASSKYVAQPERFIQGCSLLALTIDFYENKVKNCEQLIDCSFKSLYMRQTTKMFVTDFAIQHKMFGSMYMLAELVTTGSTNPATIDWIQHITNTGLRLLVLYLNSVTFEPEIKMVFILSLFSASKLTNVVILSQVRDLLSTVQGMSIPLRLVEMALQCFTSFIEKAATDLKENPKLAVKLQTSIAYIAEMKWKFESSANCDTALKALSLLETKFKDAKNTWTRKVALESIPTLVQDALALVPRTRGKDGHKDLNLHILHKNSIIHSVRSFYLILSTSDRIKLKLYMKSLSKIHLSANSTELHMVSIDGKTLVGTASKLSLLRPQPPTSKL